MLDKNKVIDFIYTVQINQGGFIHEKSISQNVKIGLTSSNCKVRNLDIFKFGMRLIYTLIMRSMNLCQCYVT